MTALGRVPTRVHRLIAGAAPTMGGVPLEPEVAAALRPLSLLPGSSFEDLPLPDARAQIDREAAMFGGPPLPLHEVRHVRIPSEAGGMDARLYRAAARDADRLLVYFHGGGWVVGSLDSADSACRFLARHAGVSVLSVGYRRHYLGDQPATHPRVSPLLADDLSGLPSAYVAVSGFDVLRDEGEAYARRMAEAGTLVALRRHDGLVHAFVNATGVGTTAREAMLKACGALRAGVGAGVAAV